MMKRAILAFLLLTSTLSQAQDEEWDDFFMPGVGYRVYTPRNSSLGIYQGPMAEFVIYARAKGSKSNKSGPSRIRTFGNLGILWSNQNESKDIFLASTGIQLTFEGKADRKFLLPYFGLEIGGLFQRDFSTFQFTPGLGIQVFSTKNLIWNLNAGYQYTTGRFDEFSGLSFSSSLNLLLWNT